MKPLDEFCESRAGQKKRRCGPMVGPLACVLGHPATELAKGHYQDSVLMAGLLEPRKKRRKSLGPLPKKGCMDVGLIGMGIETVECDVIDPCLDASENKPRDGSKFFAQQRFGKVT